MPQRDKLTRLVDGREVPGLFHHAFIHNGGIYFLAHIEVYQDGMVDCWGLVDIEEFKRKVAQGWVVTSLPEGARVCISFLVDMKATDVEAWIKEDEFIKEILDDIEQLNSRPTAGEKCRRAYEQFQKEPTEEGRMLLREAYEFIPEHNRRFSLGDMDVQDIPIRMIIYGEGEIEGWSHRIVSRRMGLKPLPNIKVAKVVKGKTS